MNKLIKNIACTVMAFTLITGVFTGCKKNEAVTTVELPEYTSVKDPSGELPEKGTVGDMEYEILSKEEFGCYNKERGYYQDQLEQLDTPYFIVISAGIHLREDAEINIVDLGMQGSTLVIVVEDYEGSGAKNKELDCPCAVLEVNSIPEDILIVTTTGEQLDKLTF